jgi:hypothetical protein
LSAPRAAAADAVDAACAKDLAFLEEKLLRPLEQKHWNGSWKSVEPANPVAAYAADASPASSESEVAKSAGAATPTVQDQRPLCHRWQKGQECKNDPCDYAHPNGRSRCDKGDEVCSAWFTTQGCNREKCRLKHPNGKSAKDASSRNGRYNRRDLTPVGARHTPSDEIVKLDPKAKGEPVKVDPEATAAHERNRNRRIKYSQTDSD